MYVILTTKPGQFHSVPGANMQPVESWDYLLCGRLRARFTLAEVTGTARVTIVDDTPPRAVNTVPAKFLPAFPSLEAARAELQQLANPAAGFSLERSGVAA